MLHAVPHDRRVGKGRGGARNGAAEHPLLALQRSAGNAAVARAILARRFDPEAWQKAIAERAQFMARRFEHDAWRPSTHRGNFGVLYEPMDARLTITVRCAFWFKDGNPSDWDDDEAGPDPHRWGPAEILKFKADFMRKVSAKWSDQFTFYCGRPWWEDLQAAVQVRFTEVAEADAHYVLNVTKIPEDEYRKSTVWAPGETKGKKRGRAKLNSEVLQPAGLHGGGVQTPAYHEAGHMLGLGDEYPGRKEAVAHEKLVQAEFGHGVPRKHDGSIMSVGNDVKPWHGVTFLEALRGVTGVPEWSHTQRRPTPGPAFDLSPPVDGPMPQPQNPLAPGPPVVAIG
jgi:hypothetical protein